MLLGDFLLSAFDAAVKHSFSKEALNRLGAGGLEALRGMLKGSLTLQVLQRRLDETGVAPSQG